MKRLFLPLAVLAACLSSQNPRPIQAQSGEFKLTDAPLRKSWGPLKASVYDPRYGIVLIFEATDGTIRCVQSDLKNMDTRLIAEFRRG